MASGKKPLVSISMTVFNAAPFIAKTIESLLAQEHPCLELIISDNASEDGSSEICRDYARRDDRIRFYRNTMNMGPARSSIKAVDLCSGEFIMCAADHDVYHPRFIPVLLNVLQQEESAVVAYPRTVMIDEKDQPVELVADALDTRGLDPSRRFSKTIWEFSWGNMFYGLHRASFLKKALDYYTTIGSDHTIFAKLSLVGSVVQADTPLFFRRMNRSPETAQEQTRRQNGWFVRSRSKALAPWTMLAYEHIKVVRDSGLTAEAKDILFADTRNCFRHRFGTLMLNEAFDVLNQIQQLSVDAYLPSWVHRDRCMELGEIVDVCRYFFPEISAHSQFESLKSLLRRSDPHPAPAALKPYYQSCTDHHAAMAGAS